MGRNEKIIDGLDIPIVRLKPRNERKVTKKQLYRIEASLKAVGLIEPLIVYPQEDDYEILDGYLRYIILLDMGVETVPCIVWNQREAFTGNRMVNRLSPSQEMRMLRKSLEELDEQTIANALGMARIREKLHAGLLKKLDPKIVKLLEDERLDLKTAKELAHVKPERQIEIFQLMESCNDFGVVLARALVLKTPVAKRVNSNSSKTPWARCKEQKSDLLKKLQEAEQQQDFFSSLYKQYTVNLLKLVIYIRSWLSNENVRNYLSQKHPGRLDTFEEIVNSTQK
jgi:ParB family transcriptional regulator, chromosome partitioning protein